MDWHNYGQNWGPVWARGGVVEWAHLVSWPSVVRSNWTRVVLIVLLYFRLFTFSHLYWVCLYFPVLFCLSVSVKWLAVKTASEMTSTVSGGTLNSTQTKPKVRKLGFIGDLTPKIGSSIDETPKRQLVRVGVVWAIKRSQYSIAEPTVLELIPVLCSQPAGDVSYKPGGSLPDYFPPGLQLL